MYSNEEAWRGNERGGGWGQDRDGEKQQFHVAFMTDAAACCISSLLLITEDRKVFVLFLFVFCFSIYVSGPLSAFCSFPTSCRETHHSHRVILRVKAT